MKRLFLLLTIFGGLLLINNSYAKDSKVTKDQMQTKSKLNEVPAFGNPLTSYPYPFVQTGDPITNAKDQAQISTGYYWTVGGDKAGKPWTTDPTILDTGTDALNWTRILSGPNQRDASYWQTHKNEGSRFFYNPNDATDSVDNAMAGPMPIGFNFVFNGIVYDSFYVFTNGAIMLANPRYYYDANGAKEVRTNNYGQPDNCYNPMSEDWFNRGRTGDGLSDATADDWGRQRAANMASQPGTDPSNFSAPVIAPFWGDGILSQWDDVNKTPRDRGKVFVHRDNAGYQTIIYFVDWQLKGSLITDMGQLADNGNVGFNGTGGANTLTERDYNYIACNAQIILDKRDSSVTITFEHFKGRSTLYNFYIFYANQMVRCNTVCGTFGYARHLNYDSKQAKTNPNYTGTLPWANRYFQSTYSWHRYIAGSNDPGYPAATQAIKFKQWKNTLRVCDIEYRVRPQKENSPDYTVGVKSTEVQNFEILAGHDQVGQLQPVSIVENLTNDIQGPSGVNFQPQDLNFRVRCAIINLATLRPLYNKYVDVDSLALARKLNPDVAYERVILSKAKLTSIGSDYQADTANTAYYDGSNNLLPTWDGVPPYGFVQIYFPPFEPNELFKSNIGLMKCYVMADPTDPATGTGFKDMWPFDDTLSARFWVMRQIPNNEPFVDDVSEYHVIPDDNNSPTPIPSVFKWVSIGATVVSGEDVSRHPLPPRGEFLCQNQELYPGFKIESPTIKLVRPPEIPMGSWGGNELRSFPIDMLSKPGAVLTLDVQRSTNRPDWERGYSDAELIGIESRVVQSNWYAETQAADQINVDFSKPSPYWPDGTLITNIAPDDWRYHLRRGGAAAEKKMAAYTLFGGGGYEVGFLETDRDSSMAPPVYSPSTALAENGLRYDFFDDGIDFEYQKLYVPIPDTFIIAPNDGAKYFRFRVQLYAKNNQLAITTIPDDDDACYLDNIRILYADNEDVDIEMTKVTIDWPYTVAPASQAIAIPVRVQLSNNTAYNTPSYWVKTAIVKKSDFDASFFLNNAWVWHGDPNDSTHLRQFEILNQLARDSARADLMANKTIYCRVKQLPFLRPGANESITMPNWNARLSPPGQYILIGAVYVPGGDLEPLNDTTYSPIDMVFGPIFAYHPINGTNVRNATNDIAGMLQDFGRGLDTKGYQMGGVSSFPIAYEAGDLGGVGGSGEIAMQFELTQRDTIFGYGGFFCPKNAAPDYIDYKLYDGDALPGNMIQNSMIQTTRGYDQLLDSNGLWNQFVFVLLPKPIVLDKGKYWVSVAQLGENGIELGASKSKGGMRCTNVYYANPQTDPDNGSIATYLNLDKSWRQMSKYGTLLNKNFFAFENGLGSGEWAPFTPTTGNPSYAHLLHNGRSPVDNTTLTYSRGSWLPLLVPYMGNRTFSQNIVYEKCDDWTPVNLSYFRGSVRSKVVDLVWETATENNNYGFYVEKRIVGGNNQATEWKTLPDFVYSKTTGIVNVPQDYNYVDKDVNLNTTYQYRLRQVDVNGTQSCDNFSNIVTLTYTNQGSIALGNNKPNPVYNNESTVISYSIPTADFVTMDVVDIYGNVVKTLVNTQKEAGSYVATWDGTDNSGNSAASGTYIYRLKVGDKVLTGKMSLVK